ncbi:MAG TPA: hypothetical protein VMW48_15245, partial [Vicinamibacterales bacterium]|nr:hypothetical protein [Vicinamibacterales bacterium]
MPFDCSHRAHNDASVCLTACPTTAEVGGFRFARVEHHSDLPAADPRVIDIAMLDMHHGWPNIGHEALVHVVQNAVCDLRGHLARAGLNVRLISYDVRRSQAVPEAPGARHAIYLGTGGPGHLDPAVNDGREGSQGIVEDPAWEARLFSLFDAIRGDSRASLFAVCHTFGVMCRWLGVADAVVRGPEKGGKSVGVRHNALSQQGREHPWFASFAHALGNDGRFPILDNRLYDLIPQGTPPPGVQLLALECDDRGTPGNAVTMVEVSRGADGVIPRIIGVNHHPEIVNRQRQLVLLEKKRARGGGDEQWL